MTQRKPLKTNIKIEIAGANIVIEDADIELEIKKTNEKEPNYCTVTIYNMADSTYNEINDKAYYVRCYADIGMKGYSLIFEGDLRNLKKYKYTDISWTVCGCSGTKRSRENHLAPAI